MGFIASLIIWSLLGGLLNLFVILTTDSKTLALVAAGLTGLVGGCTTAHLLRHKSQ